MRKAKQYITRQAMEKVAWLARIELTEEEKAMFLRQFNEILQYFQRISEVSVKGVEPAFNVLKMKNVFREDETRRSLNVDDVLMNAPRREGKFIKAPKMV